MSRVLRFSLFAVLFMSLCARSSKSSPIDTADSSRSDTTVQSKSILLAKKDSYLENAVSRIIVDSLTIKGFTVKIIDVNSLTRYDPNQYRASIIFSGVEGARLFEPVLQYKSNLRFSGSNLLICRVNGELWDEEKFQSDAVTAATKALNPAHIAARILSKALFIVDSTAPRNR